MAGEGADRSGGDREPSANVSRKTEFAKLSRGGMFDRLMTGFAQSGILISTCLGRSRKESTEVLRTATP